MARGRNNLLGVGGQRTKLSRADTRGPGPDRTAGTPGKADGKEELLRRMRERTATKADEQAGDDTQSA